MDKCREAFEKFILSKGRYYYRIEKMPDGEEYEETMTEEAWKDWQHCWNSSHDRCAEICKMEILDKDIDVSAKCCVSAIKNDKVKL